MDRVADYDRDRRRTEQSVRFHVPSRACEHGTARRRQRGEVGQRGAGYEGSAAFSGEVQHVKQPFEGNLFEDCADGRR